MSGFKHESIGDGYIHIKHTLDVFSNDSGDLDYEGNPETIETDMNASGKLIPLE